MRYEVMKFENIRSLRIDSGLTQQQIAKILDISQNTYSQYEIGVLNYPVDALLKPADFYGFSVDYLLGRTSVKTPYPKVSGNHRAAHCSTPELSFRGTVRDTIICPYTT